MPFAWHPDREIGIPILPDDPIMADVCDYSVKRMNMIEMSLKISHENPCPRHVPIELQLTWVKERSIHGPTTLLFE